MRRQHDVGQLHEPGRQLGLALVDVEPRAGDDARAQRLHQRRFVHDRPARRVDEVGRGLHQTQAHGVDEVVRGGSVGHVQAHHVGCTQQIIQRHRTRGEGSLDRGVDGTMRVVHHGHGEAPGAPCYGTADTPQPHDAQRLAVHIDAQ